MIKINSKKIKKEDLEKELEKLKVSNISEVKKSKPSSILTPVDFEENNIDLNYLFSLNGEEFIKNAYRYILEREPDPEGFHYYLNKIQSGELSKTDVLIRLRFSKEGRSKKKKFKHLYLKAIYSALSHIKFISYPIRLVKNILLLPSIEKRINVYENLYIPSILKVNHELKELNSKFLHYENEHNKLLSSLKYYENIVLDLNHQVANLNHQVTEMKATKEIPEILESEPILMQEKDKDFYSTFENTFRGSKDIIKKYQKIYLKYLHKSNLPVLDVGFGRGEFLELLKNENIPSIGIDTSKEFVDIGKEKGFKVFQEDVIKFLKETNMNFSNITAFHVIEHLSLEEQIEFVKEAFQKLEEKGKLIIETPNPKFIEAFSNFYIDPTHKKPLPPETLIFFFEYFGFKNIKLLYLHPISTNIPSKEKEEKYYRDYAVIGEKWTK